MRYLEIQLLGGYEIYYTFRDGTIAKMLNILTLTEFSDVLNGRNLPYELLQILEFQNQSDGRFSEGFNLSANYKQHLYYEGPKNPDYLNNLIPFARANFSGSFYAFWDNSTTADLKAMPIVIFGDEGGEHIVAENLLQLPERS